MPVLPTTVPYDVLTEANGALQLEINSIPNLGRQAGNKGGLELRVDRHLDAPIDRRVAERR